MVHNLIKLCVVSNVLTPFPFDFLCKNPKNFSLSVKNKFIKNLKHHMNFKLIK